MRAFLDFLRSEEYNLKQIRECADLPANPAFHRHPDLLRPAGRTNEWALHAGIADIAENITYGRIHSPWLLYRNIQVMEKKPITLFMFGKLQATEVVQQIHRFITEEIKVYLKRHPEAKAAHAAACERQARIDALKAAGQPVPAGLIDNSFARAYLVKMGKAN